MRKPEKVSFPESQTGCVEEGGRQARGPGLRGTLIAVRSLRSRPCRGPPGSPPGSQSPSEPPRGELSPEARRGRRQPTERVRQREGTPRAGSCRPFPKRGWDQGPGTPALAAAVRSHSPIPGVGGCGCEEKRDREGTSTSVTLAPSPSPSSLCFNSSQRSSPTPGSIFAPSRLSSVTRPPGDWRIGGRPGWGAVEHPRARR